jgi:hypothetical protein
MNFQTTIDSPSAAAPVGVRMLNTQEAADYLDAWIAKHRAASSAEIEERARARITRKDKAKAKNGAKQELGGNPCLHSGEPNQSGAVG